MTISDEQLAQVAWEAYLRTDDPALIRHSRQTPEPWLGIARAVRAALTPPVTPLAPGETVTIPTVTGTDTGGIRIMGNPRVLALSLESSDGWWDGRFLDAAGVQALIDVARRWQAAQEDE